MAEPEYIEGSKEDALRQGRVHIGVAITVSCAFFMENFDGTVLATALPSIARSLGVSVLSASIGITAYLVALAMFISLSGWLADRFGARRTLAIAMLLFAVASLGCATASSLGVFATARTLQGIGGAMMVPVGRLIVLKTTSRIHLVRAMSLVTTPALLGASLGPPIGGFLSTYVSWRAIFLLNIPVAVIGLVLVRLYIPTLRGKPRQFDWSGFLLSGGAVGSAMLGMQSLVAEVVRPGRMAVLFGFAAVLFCLMLRNARRNSEGLVDLSLLRYPTFASVVYGGGLFFVSAAAVPFLLPLLLQIGFHQSAFVSGVVTLASALGGLFVKRLAPLVIRRFGFRSVLVANSLGVCLAMLLTATTTGMLPLGVTAGVVFGFGLLRSLQFSALNTIVYADIPEERNSRATSLADTLKQLWQAVGVTLSAILLGGLDWGWGINAGPRHQQITMIIMACLGLCGLAVFRRLAPEAGASVSGHGVSLASDDA